MSIRIIGQMGDNISLKGNDLWLNKNKILMGERFNEYAIFVTLAEYKSDVRAEKVIREFNEWLLQKLNASMTLTYDPEDNICSNNFFILDGSEQIEYIQIPFVFKFPLD